jgi:phosphohistidine phosphatase
MDLFLIRHAAASDGALYSADGERPLTADGRRSAQAVGASLAQHGVKLDHIVASPLVRAVETAELIAVSLGYDGELEIWPELLPEGSPQHVIGKLGPRSGRTALVGHLPSIGNLLGTLLGRPQGVSMSKMAVVRLGWTDGRSAKLVWVMTPRHLEPVASLDAL